MNILIVKTSSLGDIIHVFPAIEYLRQKYPNARIDWVVEERCAELVLTNPNIDHAIPINTRSWRKGKNMRSFFQFRKSLQEVSYDVLFDFQGNTKSALVTFLAKALKKVGYGKSAISEWPNLLVTNRKFTPPQKASIRASNLFLVQSYFEDLSPFASKGVSLCINAEEQQTIREILKNPVLENRKKILVSAGSIWKNKQMNEASFTHFLKSVTSDNSCGVLIIWGNEEEKIAAKILENQLPSIAFAVDKLSLPCLQNLMNEMDYVIAMDSLALHLAGTTKTRTFGVFGPSNAAKYKPEGANHHAFQGVCPYNRTFEKRCALLRTCPTGACIRSPIEKELFDEWVKFTEDI